MLLRVGQIGRIGLCGRRASVVPTVPPSILSAPTISGTAQSGQALTGSRGSYDNSPTSFTNQWQSSATGGTPWSNISAATSLNFTPNDALVGLFLRLREVATNAAGSTGFNNSAPSAAVIAAAAVTLSAPRLVPQASPTTFPPAPAYGFDAPDIQVGDKLRIQAASDYAFGTVLVDDATVTLTGVNATDKAAINAKLAGISSGVTYLRARVERTAGSLTGAWSNIVQHGTAAVPTVTSGLNASVNATFQLANELVLSGPVAGVLLGGDDQIHLEIAGANLAASNYTERWAGDGTRAYAPPVQQADFDLDHDYDRTVTPIGLNGVVGAAQAGAITVIDYDTVPDAFTFTDVTGASLSTPTESNTITVANVAPGYVGSGTISGGWQYRKNGGALSSTSPFSWTLGDTFSVVRPSSDSYLTAVTVALALGSVSDTFSVETMADPAVTAATYVHGDVVADTVGGTGKTFAAQPFPQIGRPIIIISGGYVTEVSVGGVPGSRIARQYGDTECAIWQLPLLISTGSKDIVITFGAYCNTCTVSYGVVKDADATAVQVSPATIGSAPGDTEANPHLTETLTIPLYGIAIGAMGEYAAGTTVTPGATNTGTTQIDEDSSPVGNGEASGLIVGKRTASGALSFNHAGTARSFPRVAAVFKAEGT